MKPLLTFLLCLLTLSLFSQELTVQLNEVTVVAGENPAHRIIDSVLVHRKQNHPNSLDAYLYNVYDLMVFTVDSNVLKNNELMVMETYSEVLFRAPDQLRQNVLGTKMAGAHDPQFVYLASKMQSTSFYDDYVDIAGTSYVNPISHNSKYHYSFSLDAVFPVKGTDSLYMITFHPMPGSAFNGLKGSLAIRSDNWALLHVMAEPDKQASLYNISIQQLYEKVYDHWFPSQFEFKLELPQVAVEKSGLASPVTAIGKSYITNVLLNPNIDRNEFSEVELLITEDAPYQDEAFWNRHRIDSLSPRVKNTYHFMDSITQGTNIFDWALGLTTKMIDETALPIGPVDLNFGSMFRLSGYRGFFAGLNLTTNDRLSRHLRLNAFGGYWTKLKDFDYGGEAKWLINRQRQTELGVRYNHRSSAIGEFGGFGEGSNLLSENEYRYTFYENVMTRGNTAEAFFNTRLLRHFKAFVKFGTYWKNYHLSPYDTLPTTRLTNAELRLRFAYKEKFVSTSKGIQSQGTDYPIVWLIYQHSFKDIWGGEYDFDRLKFQVEKDFQWRYRGKSSVLLQAGYASTGCPVQETFNLMGSYEKFGLYSPGSFGTMRESEFFCNRFVALFLSHDFQGTLWNPKTTWFKPQLTLSTALAWGSPTMTQGYFESGFVVKGLLNSPIVSLGAGLFYRYGPYALPNTIDNFAFKYSMTFKL